jgi:predicted NBD/HSP70 family sugar kinase
VGWEDLESQFHQYFDSGVTEKGIADLVDVRQGSSESESHYIQRFRDVRNQCYSLTLSDAKLVGIAIQGLLPALKEKISGDYPNLAALAKKLAAWILNTNI